jgi:hypothetical protein
VFAALLSQQAKPLVKPLAKALAKPLANAVAKPLGNPVAKALAKPLAKPSNRCEIALVFAALISEHSAADAHDPPAPSPGLSAYVSIRQHTLAYVSIR